MIIEHVLTVIEYMLWAIHIDLWASEHALALENVRGYRPCSMALTLEHARLSTDHVLGSVEDILWTIKHTQWTIEDGICSVEHFLCSIKHVLWSIAHVLCSVEHVLWSIRTCFMILPRVELFSLQFPLCKTMGNVMLTLRVDPATPWLNDELFADVDSLVCYCACIPQL